MPRLKTVRWGKFLREIVTEIILELPTNSQKPFFKCKTLVINTTKGDLCLFLQKICCKMVWKFCEIWKILWELASRWAKFCEILSHSGRYGMYELPASGSTTYFEHFAIKSFNWLIPQQWAMSWGNLSSELWDQVRLQLTLKIKWQSLIISV